MKAREMNTFCEASKQVSRRWRYPEDGVTLVALNPGSLRLDAWRMYVQPMIGSKILAQLETTLIYYGVSSSEICFKFGHTTYISRAVALSR